MNVAEHLYYYVIHSCVYTHIEVLALGTVVLVIKVTKFTLNVVEQDSICRGGTSTSSGLQAVQSIMGWDGKQVNHVKEKLSLQQLSFHRFILSGIVFSLRLFSYTSPK